MTLEGRRRMIVGVTGATGIITLSMCCPACRKIHQWKQKDAWVEGEGGNGKFSN